MTNVAMTMAAINLGEAFMQAKRMKDQQADLDQHLKDHNDKLDQTAQAHNQDLDEVS